ncbi:membrane protein [Actinomadura sp. NBRC 104412]|uniref:GtrA family protein n=1 Tax=Actinomadura sp. NBRC 104412 TaxID=3032203 RepID=UPI0024A4A63A|nr:GtrA family protein [Actinomadura sp. NBRC 104412]GLZ03948.1 membrane protein [Actinomadura sp. NBRC 104412]
MNLLSSLHRRFAYLVRELAKFGSVGAVAFVITVALSNALHSGVGMGPLSSNAIATVVATTFAYVANRFWTFRHRDRTGLGREYTLFFALNGVGLVITQIFIGFVHYVLHLTGPVAYNVSLIVGTGVATLFRFWSYKKWVFLPVEAASGLPETTALPGTKAAQRVNGHAHTPHGLGRPIGPRLSKADDQAEFSRTH